jgi:hypothetical protein
MSLDIVGRAMHFDLALLGLGIDRLHRIGQSGRPKLQYPASKDIPMQLLHRRAR